MTIDLETEKQRMKSWIQIDPANDLGSHQQVDKGSPNSPLVPRRRSDGDSYYVISCVKDQHGHQFTALFHFFIVYKEALERLGFQDVLVASGHKEGFAQVAVSLLRESQATKDGYLSCARRLTDEEVEQAQKTPQDSPELKIRTPLGTLEGNAESLKLQASMTKDKAQLYKVDLIMKDKKERLPLPYLATGVIPFARDIDYEYALPNMETSGTVTIGNTVYTVTGRSWLDREFGSFGACKWTWMALALPDGTQIALWDQQDKEHQQTFAAGESAFATLVEPEGSVAVASVAIREGERRFDSPRSGQHYPTAWCVSIPAKDIVLNVRLLRDDQEIIPIEEIAQPPVLTGRIEGKAEFTGTYKNNEVKGSAFVELFNLFPAFAAFRALAAESQHLGTSEDGAEQPKLQN